MIKIITLAALLLFTGFAADSQEIYDYSVANSDQQTASLNSFKGKNLLVVILPGKISDEDTALLRVIDSVAASNDTLQVIGIPDNNDCKSCDVQSLYSWYQKYLIHPNILISKPVNARRSSSQEDNLITWLTDKDKNGHFHFDVQGSGQMFYVNSSGELYGIQGRRPNPPAQSIKRVLNSSTTTIKPATNEKQ